METLPFATKAPLRSSWGCDQTMEHDNYSQETAYRSNARGNGPQYCTQTDSSSVDPTSYYSDHYEYMPAVLLNSLKRDKKPFTYTPGRLDLSEVLNDKLQKRMERKKKHLMERAMQPKQVHEVPEFEPPKQVLVMPTYNSPLEMYSMENALEALEVQAELAVADKNLATPQRTQTLPRNYKYEVKDYEPKNVTQSKAFRVLQIITDTDEQPDEKATENQLSPQKYEMSFSGTGQNKVIPSKYFQNLQRMTGTDEESSDASVQKPKVFENNVGQFQNEAKFSGIGQTKVIPSKYFQNLQRMTGTEDEEQSDFPRPDSRESNVGPFQEMRFTGTGQSKVIPSKYFQNLRRITGTEGNETADAAHQEKKGVAGAPSVEKYEPHMAEKKCESNSISASFHIKQPGNLITDSSIPVLQRPAAFLPAPPKNTMKKKTTCHVHFDAADTYYTPGSTIRPFEGTDF